MYIWLARLDVWDSDYNTFSLKDELKGVGGEGGRWWEDKGKKGRGQGREKETRDCVADQKEWYLISLTNGFSYLLQMVELDNT